MPARIFVPTRANVTDQNNKPSLDEQTFGKLIEAAYVLQEHNREMRLLEANLETQSERLRQREAESQSAVPGNSHAAEESSPREADYTLTLAEIVEAQHQIQIRHLEGDDAMAVVAERIVRITRASGAGIAILDEKTVRYRAGAGPTALPLGSETALTKAVCTTCLRTGQVLRTPDVNTEFLFDPDLCRSRGIRSLTAVPVYHNGEIVGALELYFEKINGFAEQDIHTCQLMAGLVTEAIGRASESSLKKSVAEERSSMMAAIEQLAPSLAALADGQNAAAGEDRDEGPKPAAPSPASMTAVADSACWKCGGRLIEAEQFCGNCGAPRSEKGNFAGVAKKVDSKKVPAPWLLHPGNSGDRATPSNGSSSSHVAPIPFPEDPFAAPVAGRSGGDRLSSGPYSFGAESAESNMPFAGPLTAQHTNALAKSSPSTPMQSEPVNLNPVATSTTLTKPEQPDAVWTSAAKARDFLEEISGKSSGRSSLARFWNSRRGYFYLFIALILVGLAARWGIVSSRSLSAQNSIATGKAARSKPAADAGLSAFDKLLISLGLAEPPEAQEYKGNPDTKVWVDLHTALYYCPGAELYGKTTKGKFASQREAQLDQFEPASNKTCD
jgi:putative methionine-R-sulfoxide reductase with GAF domain